MCREAESVRARGLAATRLLAQCRSARSPGEVLRAAFPLNPTPCALALLAAQIDRSLLP